MRKILLLMAVAIAVPAHAQSAMTADSIISRYIKTVGGMDKIQAVKSLRRVGKYTGGGGFEATYVQENKRPNFVREEFSIHGMTGINAWNGAVGWKIDLPGGPVVSHEYFVITQEGREFINRWLRAQDLEGT